jgi:hypothetical protein
VATVQPEISPHQAHRISRNKHLEEGGLLPRLNGTRPKSMHVISVSSVFGVFTDLGNVTPAPCASPSTQIASPDARSVSNRARKAFQPGHHPSKGGIADEQNA